jgi:hypothetical protein
MLNSRITISHLIMNRNLNQEKDNITQINIHRTTITIKITEVSVQISTMLRPSHSNNNNHPQRTKTKIQLQSINTMKMTLEVMMRSQYPVRTNSIIRKVHQGTKGSQRVEKTNHLRIQYIKTQIATITITTIMLTSHSNT